MTIIAGFSFSRQGSAPLNLATQLARTTGEKIIAAAVVERVLPAGADPIEDEYRGYLASQATASLERVVDQIPGDFDISVIVHHATSIPNGLMELAAQSLFVNGVHAASGSFCWDCGLVRSVPQRGWGG
jgi:hypothetical protein